MRHCSIHNLDYLAQCESCRSERRQGLIATAGLIGADREVAALPVKLVAALEQARKMFQYIIESERVDPIHRQAEQGLVEINDALEAATKAGVCTDTIR